MNNYMVGYCTDVGICKKVNQDSLCVKKAQIGERIVIMAALCDGMGGLSKGELASATAVRSFSRWFMEELPNHNMYLNAESIKSQWREIIDELNTKLWNYGNENGVQLGTTITVLLILNDEKYLIAHVGDSRAYKVSDDLIQLTEDHSYVAREVKRGNMTREEAARDPRKNVLLQCVGASKSVQADIFEGSINATDGFLLCSDGFRHQITEAEILHEIRERKLEDKEDIDKLLALLVNKNMERGEKDNISAILICSKANEG